MLRLLVIKYSKLLHFLPDRLKYFLGGTCFQVPCSLYSSQKLTDHVSHPYQRTFKTAVCHYTQSTETPSSGAHPASYSMGTGAPSPWESGRGMKLTTHLHQVPRLRICGDIPPLSIRHHGVVLD